MTVYKNLKKVIEGEKIDRKLYGQGYLLYIIKSGVKLCLKMIQASKKMKNTHEED